MGTTPSRLLKARTVNTGGRPPRFRGDAGVTDVEAPNSCLKIGVHDFADADSPVLVTESQQS